MIQVVKNSKTTAKIQKEFGGATKAFSKRPLKSWLQQVNSNKEDELESIDNFTRYDFLEFLSLSLPRP